MKLAWVLVGVLGILAAATLLFTSQAQAAPPRIEGATYVGSDTCKGCHEEVAKKMEGTLHGKLLGTNLAKGEIQARGCEGCHGPGSKHLEDAANPANNFRFGKKSALTAEEMGAVCLQCHARGKQILWKGSQHDLRDVTCVTCHSVHAGSAKGQLKIVKPDAYDSRGQLLDKVQYDLCGQCHQVKAMQFQRSSHMPMTARGEGGRTTCTSCHNPHGTTTEKLISAVSVNEKCTSCHAAKRGPFLWEHPPVLENCLNCHQAHGSNLQSLLRVQPPRLCQQCHANSGHNYRPYTPPGGAVAARMYNRSCVNCHLNIHGSNHPSGTDFTR
ncbi:MAG TPA: DmsE family decaheme c-type cytochrome [Candidatus Methylomirabilis sp.]